jgi:hypothetical protein
LEVGREVEKEVVEVDIRVAEEFDNLVAKEVVVVDGRGRNNLVANHRLENRVYPIDRFDNLYLVGRQFEENLRRMWCRSVVLHKDCVHMEGCCIQHQAGESLWVGEEDRKRFEYHKIQNLVVLEEEEEEDNRNWDFQVGLHRMD